MMEALDILQQYLSESWNAIGHVVMYLLVPLKLLIIFEAIVKLRRTIRLSPEFRLVELTLLSGSGFLVLLLDIRIILDDCSPLGLCTYMVEPVCFVNQLFDTRADVGM